MALGTLPRLAGGMGHPPCAGRLPLPAAGSNDGPRSTLPPLRFSICPEYGISPLAGSGAGWRPNPAGSVLFFTRFVEIVGPTGWPNLLITIRKSPPTRIIIAGTPVQPLLDEPFRRQVAATPAGGDVVQWRGYVAPADSPVVEVAIPVPLTFRRERAAPASQVQCAPGYYPPAGCACRRQRRRGTGCLWRRRGSTADPSRCGACRVRRRGR